MRWPHFDLHGILLEIREDIGWIKGRMSSIQERQDRLEAKVQQRRSWTWDDIQPWLLGAVILVAALAGKMELALGILSGR